MNIQLFDIGNATQEALALIFRRSMIWAPERGAPSPWVEHVPFAFWLVDVLRPRRIVELGTHNGVSYLAMCQAVKSLELATSCFAIDTWKGDAHAGFYGEDIYRNLTMVHDRSYGAFSQLVRSTFDEALRNFQGGSIDLLHIDGLHTYEAVQHDYESWLPKLSANAVVLFHGTNVRERDFGVFRLWDEITAGRPSFSFLHGHGLGVLGRGRDYPDALRVLFGAGEEGRFVGPIRDIFRTLGRSVRLSAERRHLDQSLTEHASELARLREALAAREEELGCLKEELAQREDELPTLKEELKQKVCEICALRQEQADRSALLNRIFASRSWRLTRPLRLAGRLLRGEWSSLTGARPTLIRIASSIYRWLPLSSANKWRLASLAYRVAGPLFKGIPSYDIWRSGNTRAPCTRTPEMSRAIMQSAAEFMTRSRKENASGWVLVADDFLPLHDQQSGGLRLKMLIDIIGDQGWPMVFASRLSRSELPGVLSSEVGLTRYETELKASGISHFAYGLDEIDAMLAALGANLRYAFLSRPYVAHVLIPRVRSRCPTTTIIYDMVDFHAKRIAREAALKHDASLLLKANEIRAVEMAAVRSSDITTAISNEEKSAVLELVPSAVIETLPNIFTMKAADPPGVDRRSGLLFVGGFWHRPNGDAMTWFVEKIWPQVLSQIPHCQLRIAGSNPGDEVIALARKPGVQVLGFIPDLTPLFDSARVFIAPLRYGAGVKGKVGQSLAHGLPVVTTSIGAEGMNLIDGEHALIADDPAVFTSHIVRLLSDDVLWARLQAQGRTLVATSFSVNAVRGKVMDLFHV